MTILVRYMYSRLALAALAITAVLAVNEMLYKTKELYQLLFADVITMTQLLTVWATLMPVVFYHLGPEMVTIALLARYYLWRQHNEILTLRTIGLSCWQIALPGIVIGAGVGIFCAVMSIAVLPQSFATAQGIRAIAENRIAPHMLEPGKPNSISPDVSLSFQRWISGEGIGEVVITRDRKPGDFDLLLAERGMFVENEGDYVLILENGSQLIHNSDDDVRLVAFDRLAMPLDAPVRSPAQVRGYYEEQIWRLLNPPDNVRQNPQMLAAWVSEGHHRIINPLRCIGCAVLLLGVLVPGLQGYVELLVRLAVAAALTFAEMCASTIGFSLAQRHAQGAPLLYLLPIISGGIGALLLFHGDRRISRWWRLARPRFGSLRGPEAAGYTGEVIFAGRASSE